VRIKTVEHAHEFARRRLPAPVFDYIEGAAGAEITARQNRQEIEDARFTPAMATGLAPRDLSTTVLGQSLSMPIILGPVGFTRSMHPHGDVAGARAAAAAGTVLCQSSMSGHTIEEVAAATDHPGWFQLYNLGGREGAEQLVARAQAAGCPVLMVTIDTPVPGNRERDLRYGASLPVRVNRRTIRAMAPYVAVRPRWLMDVARDHFSLSLANAVGLRREGRELTEDEALVYWVVEPFRWVDLARIRAMWPGRLLIKGVLSGDDARRALDLGADGVAVSNHGGRQLDQVAASLTALTEVVAAVGSRTEVLVDGGFRRGSDVAVALCLGARAVLLGRAWVYGLAAAGQPGVSRVLDAVRADLARTAQLLGVGSLADLGLHHVTGVPTVPVAPTSVD
jgi:isopentenyl diphosphate isomerase/L-lactate dehydrogenase-like FMN-dependent dehydrogenase